MKVQNNPVDIGRCGCGRRQYCDGSHALTEVQWQAVLATERKTALENSDGGNQQNTLAAPSIKP